MTILIGVLCQDGVVIGADSSALFSAGPIPTIEQGKVKKVSIVSDDVIIAGTGQIGLYQRFRAVVTQQRNQFQFHKHDAIAVGKEVAKFAINDFAETKCDKGQFGALMAFVCQNGEHHLCEFALRDFQPELKNDEIWWVSMGSGQPITDPFLGFIRKVFWKDKKPLVKEAVFSVVWALQHVIELNPGGINGPSRLAVLQNKKAKLLTDAEIDEHIASVADVEKYLADYPQTLLSKASKAIPGAEAPAPKASDTAGAKPVVDLSK
jgi:20S proteasome alpha/beta subunit